MSIFRFTAKRLVTVGSLAVLLIAVSFVVSVVVWPWGVRDPVSPTAVAFAARGAEKVKAAYGQWVREHDAAGGDRNVVVSLGYWKALSPSFTRASGLATLNLVEGKVSVTVSDLVPGDWDVWVVDNRPGPRQSIRPEPADVMVRVGRLVRDGQEAKLDADLGPKAFRGFHVDLVVVAPAGGDPGTTGLLFGAPTLFQRLYTSLRSTGALKSSDFTDQAGIAVRRPFAKLLGLGTAEADGDIFVNEDVVFSDLVAKGAELFLNETFRGNGRTCASCHPAAQNFTIDVNFIATLPDDDPLFAAEFIPALAFSPAGRKFEVPPLMRKHALIVENVDGTEDLVNKFTMRGVPHTLGMRNSLTPNASSPQPPNQRTGWGGDGAPGNGTLRDFATGAVTQHFTKTLRRLPGTDFRLPTDRELDAMEAFQLSLGRQVEVVLPLGFKDPQVARGQVLFVNDSDDPVDPGGGCHACHGNGGANASFGAPANRNFNTGIENQRDRPAILTLQKLGIDLTPGIASNILPRDGGFGKTAGEGPDGTGFGDGEFNTVSLHEAADSGPFFHDNSIATIEGAVEFYNSQEFATAQGQPRLNLGATQVEAIAAFLRVLNALDNIREATEAATAAKNVASRHPRAAAQLLSQAKAESEDALRVLFARGLHTAAVGALDNAIKSFARATGGSGIDRSQIDRGLQYLARARADMVQ